MASRWQAARFGGPEALQLAEVDVAPPRSGEVVVDVRAVGMNPADYEHMLAVLMGRHPAGKLVLTVEP
jgi:NADPH:quinone reductase